jgi:hypothetical protein
MLIFININRLTYSEKSLQKSWTMEYRFMESGIFLLSRVSFCLFQASDFLFTYGSLRHMIWLLGRGISPAPRPLPTQDNTTQRITDTHSCPEQDSNLRSQCSSGRRQYMPWETVFPFLGSTAHLRPWHPPQNPDEFLGGLSTIFFLQGRIVSPTPNPHTGGPGLCIYIPQRQGGYPF